MPFGPEIHAEEADLRAASRLCAEILKPTLSCFGNRIGGPYRRLLPIVDVVQHDLHTIFKTNFGMPSQLAFNLSYICPRTIGLAGAFWNVHNIFCGNQFNQPVHTVRVVASHVEDSTDFVRVRRGNERVHDIGDKCEISRLRAISDNRQRLASDQLGQETPKTAP